MNRFETTINTLRQLSIKISDKHFGDIEYLEDEDDRYTIALDNAISALNACNQIIWERDTAIEQLKELGFEFGEKVCYKPDEVNNEKIKLDGIWIWSCGKCGSFHSNEYPLNYCSSCGAKIDWSDYK